MPGAINFVPQHQAEYYRIVDAAYARARAEAVRIATTKRIAMKIEFLKPVHLDLTDYKVPGSADKQYTLKSNCAIFPYGVLNYDPTWDYIKWWKGAKTNYIGDWFVKPVYFFEERQGAYAGKREDYEFRGNETFTFNAHSTTSSTELNGWILAFAVMPVTLEEVKIVT